MCGEQETVSLLKPFLASIGVLPAIFGTFYPLQHLWGWQESTDTPTIVYPS